MKLFIALFTLAVSASAFSQAHCESQSNGYNFNHESRNEEFSRKKVTALCQAAAYTDNQECVINTVCGEESSVKPYQQCETQSNGYNFQKATRDLTFTQDKAIKACQAAAYTDNVECQINLSCKDGTTYPDYVSCSTTSNGYNFQKSSRNQSFSAEKAVKNCQAAAYTDNEECEVNLQCDGQN